MNKSRLKELVSGGTAAWLAAALLAAFFTWLTVLRPFASGEAVLELRRLAAGSYLLAGVLHQDAAWGMPLFSALFSAALNLGLPAALLPALFRFLAYLLVFSAGALLRGRRAGLAALAAAGAFEFFGPLAFDDEQAVYSFFLLLVLNMLLLRERENTPRSNFLLGLSVGLSLLVRTPLLFFPPLLAAAGLVMERADLRRALPKAALLLAGAYALLLPWGLLHRHAAGSFSFTDGQRAACNLITGALGSVYTMEGDCRALAGLGPQESALAFYLKAAAREPHLAAFNAARRVYHAIGFYPLLFGAFLLGAFLGRRRLPPAALALPAYFMLVHAAMSVEARYFYPMLFLLPPLAAAGLWPGRTEGDERAGRLPGLLLPAALLPGLAAAALAAAYPLRALPELPGKQEKAAAGFFSKDRALRGRDCRGLWAAGDEAGYLACLASYARDFGAGEAAYFLGIRSSSAPSSLPKPPGLSMEADLLLMLRQLELGDKTGAREAFVSAHAVFTGRHNTLRGEPYRRDKEIAAGLEGRDGPFWDDYVYGALLMFPAASTAAIYPRLAAEFRPGHAPRLAAAGELLALGDIGLGVLRKRAAFDGSGLPARARQEAWARAAAAAKPFSDEAVELLRAGKPAGAEAALLKALAADPASPEALMTLCAARAKLGRAKEASAACRAAELSVRLNPENRSPALEALAAAARAAAPAGRKK